MLRNERQLRLQLVRAGAVLSSNGLIRPGEGNLSARSGESFFITPAGADKGQLSARDLIPVRIDGSTIPALASSETQMHREIYQRMPDIAAIVHAHPTAVLRLAGQGEPPDVRLTELGRTEFGAVGWTGFLPPGSAELARAVARALESTVGCVLDQHGAVTIGDSVEAALRRMVLLEQLAAITPLGRR